MDGGAAAHRNDGEDQDPGLGFGFGLGLRFGSVAVAPLRCTLYYASIPVNVAAPYLCCRMLFPFMRDVPPLLAHRPRCNWGFPNSSPLVCNLPRLLSTVCIACCWVRTQSL